MVIILVILVLIILFLLYKNKTVNKEEVTEEEIKSYTYKKKHFISETEKKFFVAIKIALAKISLCNHK